jgi:hypothetical protein
MTEELLAAVADLSERARERNPEFAMAAEADLDRYVPFVDVFYRAATPRSISPLRYAFPEWTSCVHCMGPYDHAAVNGALMLGAVLVVEPHQYTAPMDDDAFAPLAAYVEECLALRERLADRIFLADYRDTRGATVESDGAVQYRVHARHGDGARAVVVANYGREAVTVEYDVPGADSLRLVTPGGTDREVPASGAREVPGDRVAVLLEE